MARRLTVYRSPRPEHREYSLITLFREEDTVLAGGVEIVVRDLLPPAEAGG